ncbi:ATP-binding cassette domain-containing protein [Buchnera aphidicola (Thelaxes californica)]|uniref:Multidrug resistance-like ATP-binding protein MdlA n=1 Tax=Buchnera aphidicola (Thelaxes californica) TaxID=1315998 RepID=A0A4D6YBZ9_9GAMM|nr:ABC transporter transmembrane domain-containing protein [Buchnera aphidicola]QCI26889.1 ATP-binding cassette domain-containing protein [Buchnera aphidicola (Thelaxes californica)]
MKLFIKLGWYFKKEWKRYLSATFLLIMIALLQLIPPKIVGKLVDIIIKKDIYSNNKAIFYIFILILIATSIYIFRCIWRILLFGAAYKLSIYLRIKFYESLSHQKSEFYLKNRTGDLMVKATNDIDKVAFAAGEGVLTLVDSFFMGTSVFFIMCQQINYLLTLITLIPMPIMAIIINNYGKKLHFEFQQSQIAFSKLNNQVQESLTNIRMIRAFNLEKKKFLEFKKLAKHSGEKNLAAANIDAKFDPIIHITIACSNLIAVIIGGWFISINMISVGQLTTFIMYLGLMVWPMLALAWMFNIVERGSAAWDRINKIIFYQKKKKKQHFCFSKINPILPFKTINIYIKSFKYPEQNYECLKNIQFNIYKGNVIGICGPTGSGKTSIIQLIQRNFEKYIGKITYNTLSINTIPISTWRSHLSIVNQSTFLFSDTIYNNIALGKKITSMKEVEKVSKIAHIHNDIIQLPHGYFTQVGEKGTMLSGGQKQRIAIARALILNTRILILDNALSAVDGITENIILNNINIWKTQENTVIIISHRLSTIKNADKIIVIKNGTILQKGTHKKLITEKNWYQTTYLYQQMKLKFNQE